MSNEKTKLSGMEMMIQSLMKAAGFNPEEIAKATVTVVDQMRNGLALVNTNLEAIRKEQEIAKLERHTIMQHLGIVMNGEILPPQLENKPGNVKAN